MEISTPVGKKTFSWDPAIETEVEMIRQKFNTLQSKGYVAFRTKQGGQLKNMMNVFDPEEEIITLIPLITGG